MVKLSERVDKILRLRIYNTRYWKEQCFGLTVATLIDKAVALDHIGGTFGGARKPCPFLCLLLKLLQIQPEQNIVLELLRNEEQKYLRALAALYVRVAWKAVDVYKHLECILKDYRKLRRRLMNGTWSITCMDEFVEELLTASYACDITLPRIPKRQMIEHNIAVGPYTSALNEKEIAELRSKQAEMVEQNNGKRELDTNDDSSTTVPPSKKAKHDSGIKGSILWWNKVRADLGMKPLII